MEDPTASLSTSDIETAGGSSHSFTVSFTDNKAIDILTLGNSDLLIDNPNGTDAYAVFESSFPGSNSDQVFATYRYDVPGGTWDHTDNGTYNVRLQSGEVLDVNGNAVLAELLGSFLVDIPVPNQDPTADIGGHYSVDEGSSITLDASFSDDSDGWIVTWEWDLDDDGLYDDANGETTSFSQANDGTYPIFSFRAVSTLEGDLHCAHRL